jgi:hypothetical protein
MGKSPRSVFVIGSALAAVVAGTLLASRRAFARRMTREEAALLAAARPPRGGAIAEEELDALPDPVRRWLRWAGVIGAELPRTVRLTQEGRFRTGDDRPWLPFTAEEVFTTDPPGFLWRTTMRISPLGEIIGRDMYAHGAASIEMRLLGLVPVARARGPELNQGALLRYLNETMWFPAAALSPAITWEAIDATAARATVVDGETSASAVFVFAADGRPVDMIAARYDLARGRIETWSTPLTDWGTFGGVRVPVVGVGLWRYDDGDFPYIDVRITSIAYDPE